MLADLEGWIKESDDEKKAIDVKVDELKKAEAQSKAELSSLPEVTRVHEVHSVHDDSRLHPHSPTTHSYEVIATPEHHKSLTPVFPHGVGHTPHQIEDVHYHQYDQPAPIEVHQGFNYDAKFATNIMHILVPNSTKKVYFLQHCKK